MDWKNYLLQGRLRKKDGYYHMLIDAKHPETKISIRHSESTKLKVEETTKAKTSQNYLQANKMLEEFREKWTSYYFSKEKKVLYFTDYMKEWLEEMKPNLQFSTYENYKRIVENKIVPYFEPKKFKLDELKARDIQEFYTYSINVCKVSNNTVVKYHANIRKALQTALKYELVKNNQADLVEKPRKKRFVASIIDRDDLTSMFEELQGTYLELPVYLAGFYGLRRSEALGLLWSSIDFENDMIEINNTIVSNREGGKKVLENRKETKTKKSRRTLPMIPQLKELLLKKKAEIESNREIFGNSYDTRYLDNVCVKEDGSIIKPDYITKKFTKETIERGFEGVTFHSLRHSFATFMFNEGVDFKSLQEWLGHSNIGTTFDTYAHMTMMKMHGTAKIIEGARDRENKKIT